MIPVRVPTAMTPVLASERRFSILPDHPLYEAQCPVCDGLLGEALAVLVFAGVEPGDRKPAGWTTGAAVAVHAFCAVAPGEGPAASLAAGEAVCAAPVDDEEEGPHDCGKLSRYVVSRSDRNTSYGEGGGTAEACEDHLSDAVTGMVDGDENVRAVVAIRWTPPLGTRTPDQLTGGN